MPAGMSIRYPVLTALAAVTLAGCGGGGDKSTPSGGSAKTPPAKSTAAQGGKFQAKDVGFTFQYPTSFKQVDEPNDGSVLASVTPTPGDVNNGLKIRKTAEKELPFESYAGQIRGQFEQQLGTKVMQSSGTRGSLKLGVLKWSNSYTKKDLGEEKTIELSSKSYFFAGSGKTWQLECLSSQDYRDQITEACKQALGSIEFTG
jgi:hypothetical protein